MATLKWGAIIVALLSAGGCLHWSLPSHDVVRIVNTEVKRGAGAGSSGADPAAADVRYITAVGAEGEPHVYRNEDTDWGWPPYFKFDSADLAATAQEAASTKETPEWVVVTHYGWRIPVFSLFPNAVSIEPATGPEASVTPWFNGVVLGLLALLALFLWLRIRRWRAHA